MNDLQEKRGEGAAINGMEFVGGYKAKDREGWKSSLNDLKRPLGCGDVK